MSKTRLATVLVETEAEVQIDLADFSDEELIAEMQDRGIRVLNSDDELNDMLDNLYTMIVGNSDPNAIVRVAHELCREMLGRVV